MSNLNVSRLNMPELNLICPINPYFMAKIMQHQNKTFEEDYTIADYKNILLSWIESELKAAKLFDIAKSVEIYKSCPGFFFTKIKTVDGKDKEIEHVLVPPQKQEYALWRWVKKISEVVGWYSSCGI